MTQPLSPYDLGDVPDLVADLGPAPKPQPTSAEQAVIAAAARLVDTWQTVDYGTHDDPAATIGRVEQALAQAVARMRDGDAAEPTYYTQLADQLYRVAAQVGTLAGLGLDEPSHAQISICASYDEKDAARTVPLVDTIAAALDMTATTEHHGGSIWRHRAQRRTNRVTVSVYCYVPSPEDSELTALRARIAELEAQQQGGAR